MNDGSKPEAISKRKERIISVAMGLGAATTGGPLSRRERRLLARRAPIQWSKGQKDHLREAIQAGLDPLGEALLASMNVRRRRKLGIYYTSQAMVAAMMKWTLRKSPETLVDAGCGSGRFTMCAVREGYDGRVVAIDEDPLATLVTRTNLAVLGYKRAQVLNCDFMESHRPRGNGKVAYIGNPPYVRYQLMSGRTKAGVRHVGSALGPGFSSLAGLHVWFLLKIAQLSRLGDIGCLILGSEWLDADHGRRLRLALAGPLGCQKIGLFNRSTRVFDDAMTTAVVVTWRVGFDGPITLKNASPSRPSEILKGGTPVARPVLAAAGRWSDVITRRRHARTGGRVPLAAFADVHRGVATGRNDYFVMSREDAKRLRLAQFVVPVLARAREILDGKSPYRKIEAKSALLLAAPGRQKDPFLRRYIELGEQWGVDRRSLCRQRRPWWQIRRPSVPDIVVSYMRRGEPRFVANLGKYPILNSLLGIHLRNRVRKRVIIRLTRWLNENSASFRLGKTYFGDLIKIEPRELERLLVPRLQDL